MTLDGGHSEGMVDGEPLAHSVLNETLDGRPMEGIPDLEPLEHSVLVMALDSGLTEGMPHLEPLEHSVLNAAWDGWPMKETSVLEPLEHSVPEMTLDSSSLEEMSDWEPLAHLVLNVTLDGRPMMGIPDLEPLEHSVLEMALDSGLTESIQHSGISTDVLLFSDIHLSLVHNYRMHRPGLPHIAFRRNYLSQLRTLLPLPVVQPTDGVVSPDSSGSGSIRPGDSSEVVDRSPRTTRRAYPRSLSTSVVACPDGH